MKKMIKVLYVSPFSEVFGAETSLINLILHLDKEMIEPFLLVPGKGELYNRIISQGFHCFTFDELNSNPGFFSYLSFNYSFLRLIKENRIDIIHFNLYKNIEKFLPALIISRIPFIVHIRMHNWIDNYRKIIIARAQKVICVSGAVKNIICEKRRSDLLTKIKEEKVAVVYNGRNIEEFDVTYDLSALRQSLNVKDSNRIVGFLGAISFRKSVDLFIKMASIIAKENQEVRFLIIGDIYSNKDLEYKKYVKDLVLKLDIADKCIFTGFRNDIPQLLKLLDILVLPSKREALGGVLIEGMAAGIPVVASNCDGVSEVLGDNEAGILLNSQSSLDFADAVIWLLENKNIAQTMKDMGRGRARKFFDIKICVEKTQNIYEEIIGKG